MGEDPASSQDSLSLVGIMELVLSEWHKDFGEIRENWTPTQLELHLRARNNRIRRQNGKEEESANMDIDELREIARQRARAARSQ